MDTNEYKMTYYVGAMLAHGGVLLIKEDRLVFSPRSFERTIGAQDTVIPFDKIKMVEVNGTITESLMIRTLEKAHRFVGSDPYKIRDRINEAMQHSFQYSPSVIQTAPPVSPPIQNDPVSQEPAKTALQPQPGSELKGSPSPTPTAAPHHVKDRLQDKCPSCSQPVRAEFHFCPYCKTNIKPSCPKCFRFAESGWKFCAFCGSNL